MFHPRNVSAIILGLAAAAPLAAQRRSAQEWARECEDGGDRRSVRHCEVREYTLRATGSLRVDAHPNGGIWVTAWDRNEVKVVAKVAAYARTEADAKELAGEIIIRTSDRLVQSDGPDTRGREGWWVSYEVYVPARTDLTLESTNGGLEVEGITGRLNLETTNGVISLRAVGGSIDAETTNGAITVSLEGSRLSDAGLRARTTNGSVRLNVPEDFNADLEVSTVHGGIDLDFPVTVRGRIGRRITTKLGNGGPPVTVETTNGGVSIRRR